MNKKTLSNKTVGELLSYIKIEGYKPGDKIPNEYELADKLGVSRNTIREALRTLSSRNVLEIKHGAGTFISEKEGVIDDPFGFYLVDDRRKLVQELIQIRSIIEPPVASLAAQNATKEDIVILEDICNNVEELIKGQKSFLDADIKFHTQLAICSKNSVMSKLIPIIVEGITLFSHEVIEQEYTQTVKAHREIFEAVRDGRSTDASQAMLFHILYNRNRFKQE